MKAGTLGATYNDGEIIVRQGDAGDRMFVIQQGRVRILIENEGAETLIREAGEGEVIGEMAIFERDVRSATVRAVGEVRLLTVEKKNFLKRVHEDPSLAMRIGQTMSRRIRELSVELAQLKAKDQ